MTKIIIRYLDKSCDNSLLGEEVTSNLSATQAPFSSDSKKNIYIRKKFVSQKTSSWKVEDITQTSIRDEKTTDEGSVLECNISLTPAGSYSRSIAEIHNSNGSKLLRGRLLECDFGYFTQDLNIDGEFSTTISNFNSKLPYEMVKRRLVVVVSNKEDPALVVPLSKKGPSHKNHKRKDVAVPVTSLPDDLVAFPNRTCFAKTSAVTSVSGHRLFPLRVHVDGKKVYDRLVEKKLSQDDMLEIKRALFRSVGGQGMLNSIESQTLEIDGKSVQIEDLKKTIQEKNKQISDQSREYDQLYQLLDEQTS